MSKSINRENRGIHLKYHGAKLILIKLQMFYQISLTYQLKCCP